MSSRSFNPDRRRPAPLGVLVRQDAPRPPSRHGDRRVPREGGPRPRQRCRLESDPDASEGGRRRRSRSADPHPASSPAATSRCSGARTAVAAGRFGAGAQSHERTHGEPEGPGTPPYSMHAPVAFADGGDTVSCFARMRACVTRAHSTGNRDRRLPLFRLDQRRHSRQRQARAARKVRRLRDICLRRGTRRSPHQ